MVGLNPSKADIDSQAGNIPRMLQVAIGNGMRFKFWLDSKTDADLLAIGYDAADITTLRSCYADFAQLSAIYAGNVGLAAPKDFRTFLRRVWGLGDL